MTKLDRAVDLLGLARRAGKLTLGAGATEAALSRGRVCGLVLASDLSPRSAVKVRELARSADVPEYSFGTKAEFGRRFGRQEVGILGVLDPSFAAGIRNQLESRPRSDPGTGSRAETNSD